MQIKRTDEINLCVYTQTLVDIHASLYRDQYKEEYEIRDIDAFVFIKALREIFFMSLRECKETYDNHTRQKNRGKDFVSFYISRTNLRDIRNLQNFSKLFIDHLDIQGEKRDEKTIVQLCVLADHYHERLKKNSHWTELKEIFTEFTEIFNKKVGI